MIILKLMDGLGNQMFQYAFGRYLQEIYHENLIFETMKLQKNAVRKLGIHRFDIPLDKHETDSCAICRFANSVENIIFQIVSKGMRIFAEKIFKIPMSGERGYHRMIRWGCYTTNDSITYYSFRKTKKKIKFVRGYFQSEKYFDPIADTVKKELQIKKIDNTAVCDLGKKMEKEDSVCIHIRRGDYIGNKRLDVCTESYYREAVKLMKTRLNAPVFYIFSNTPDDLLWIKKHYDFTKDMYFIDEGTDEFEDLYLMYHCRNHIISNSTFSWWGSYLGDSNITIAPQKWVNSDERQDILRKEWILV